LSKPNLLIRGFKTRAERLAKAYREKLGIHACNPLCGFKLADHLNIKCYCASEFFKEDRNSLSILKGTPDTPCEWSALTMVTEQQNQIIIHNDFHSSARQQSNVMHELAHIICCHEHPPIVHTAAIPFGMRSYDSVKEEEANWLGSTLQLASPCLLWAKKRSMSYDDIAEYFNASIEMVKYRMNVTGIARRKI